MTVPAYNVYGNHPRLWFRDTDKKSLLDRTQAGWKTVWDNDIVPKADNLITQSAADIIDWPRPDQRIVLLALVGYLLETDRPKNGYKDKAIQATRELANNGPTDDNGKRHRLAGCAAGFDILFNDMSTFEKDDIAGDIATLSDDMDRRVPEELLTGHSGLEQCIRMMAALATQGYVAGAQSDLDNALEFWLGNGTAPSDPGTGTEPGRLEVFRYFASDGSFHEGAHYIYRNIMWEVMWFLHTLTTATDLDMFMIEKANLERIWEQLLWNFRGDDIEVLGDTTKVTAPFFQHHYRYGYTTLAERFPDPTGTQGGRIAYWVWNEMINLGGGSSAEDYIYDLILFRKADKPANPANLTTSKPATARLFKPPGRFYFRGAQDGADPWDVDQSVVFRVNGQERYFMEHSHRDCGALFCSFKTDPVLLSPTGVYPGSIGDNHNINWNQRSAGMSGVPLVFRGATYNWFSEAVSDDGGQQYKKFNIRGGDQSRPFTIEWMLNDSSGNAWRNTSKFEHTEIEEDGVKHSFIVLDFKESYKKRPGDALDPTTSKLRCLFINPTAANGLTHPVALWYVQVIKATSTDPVVVPWHFRFPVTVESYGFRADGSKGIGRFHVDYRDIADFTLTNNPPGTDVAGTDFGADQWKINATGTNHIPSENPNSREEVDVKQHSMWVELTSRAGEERHVALLMPTGITEAPPGRTWIDDGTEPDHYAIDLGDKRYRISRTLDEADTGTSDEAPPPPAPESTGPKHKYVELDFTRETGTDAIIDHNDFLRKHDAFINCRVIAKQNTPPSNPSYSDVYRVGSQPTGDWELRTEDHLAVWLPPFIDEFVNVGKPTSAFIRGERWFFFEPFDSMEIWDESIPDLLRWDGSAWVNAITGGAGGGGSPPLLTIDHEEGNFSDYDTAPSSGDLTVAAAAALGGSSNGLSVLVDDTTNDFGKRSFNWATDTIRFRYRIDPNGLTMGNGDDFHCLELFNTASSIIRFNARLGFDGTDYYVHARVRDDAEANVSTANHIFTDADHYIEFEIQRASSDSAADGHMKIWIDGTLVETLSGIDLFDLSRPDEIRVGKVRNMPATVSGTFYMDEIVVRDDGTEIGA